MERLISSLRTPIAVVFIRGEWLGWHIEKTYPNWKIFSVFVDHGLHLRQIQWISSTYHDCVGCNRSFRTSLLSRLNAARFNGFIQKAPCSLKKSFKWPLKSLQNIVKSKSGTTLIGFKLLSLSEAFMWK